MVKWLAAYEKVQEFYRLAEAGEGRMLEAVPEHGLPKPTYIFKLDGPEKGVGELHEKTGDLLSYLGWPFVWVNEYHPDGQLSIAVQI